MRKKFLILVAVLVLIASLSSVLVACKGDDGEKGDPNVKFADFIAQAIVSGTIEKDTTVTKYDATSYTVQEGDNVIEAYGVVNYKFYKYTRANNATVKTEVDALEYTTKLTKVKTDSIIIFQEAYWKKDKAEYTLPKDKAAILAVALGISADKMTSLNLTITLISVNECSITYTESKKTKTVKYKDCGKTTVTLPNEGGSGGGGEMPAGGLTTLFEKAKRSCTIEFYNEQQLQLMKIEIDFNNFILNGDGFLTAFVAVGNKYYGLTENFEEIYVEEITRFNFYDCINEYKNEFMGVYLEDSYWTFRDNCYLLNSIGVAEIAAKTGLMLGEIAALNLTLRATTDGFTISFLQDGEMNTIAFTKCDITRVIVPQEYLVR